MAQSFTVDVMGVAPNDGSGNTIRAGGLKIAADLTEIYSEIELLQADLITPASMVRSQLTVACNGAAGQVIGFSSQFVTTYALQIIDYDGIGISVTAQDADGFTITSLSAGDFGYIALIEV